MTSGLPPEVELIAVVAGTVGAEPYVLASEHTPPALPAGPLLTDHRSLQQALRTWVEDQTGLQLGFVEQLYTFADLDRTDRTSQRSLSISYLALTRLPQAAPGWLAWYDLFPWEDRRDRPGLSPDLAGRLLDWAARDATGDRLLRVQILFGWDERPWLPELALQRYETVYEAGLVAESGGGLPGSGPAMMRDHRRIVATGISRLRSKIQYRPVIFEAMPGLFTLGQLQQAVEAIAGQTVHKQNFRRLVTGQQLVEPTGRMSNDTGGRPAELFRFRTAVRDERAVIGTKLPRPR
ncbi:NUDIX hydrolase [Propionicicella superfundia]|uniref:NUDIX hydrolase n=1 Tax=Propionicicella superfundia TaxID=348582 RepID=UPI00048ECCB4|nr:hypothetical protein [Propionicicella superfundia]